MTCEAAVFPFLFPQGKGMYIKEPSTPPLSVYLHYRMLELFSPFTLYKPYLLVMFQLRQAVVTANSITSVALEKDIVRYKKKHPGCTDEVC